MFQITNNLCNTGVSLPEMEINRFRDVQFDNREQVEGITEHQFMPSLHRGRLIVMSTIVAQETLYKVAESIIRNRATWTGWNITSIIDRFFRDSIYIYRQKGAAIGAFSERMK